jgi:hypothetical protein
MTKLTGKDKDKWILQVVVLTPNPLRRKIKTYTRHRGLVEPNFFMGYFLEESSPSSQGFNISFSQGLGLRSSQNVN